MSNLGKFISIALATFSLSACAVHNPKVWEPAKFPKASPAANKLKSLPSAGQKVAVAVYGFTDQTGQFKPTDGAQTLSRAVTQGATSILVKSLHEAGKRSWFTVIEREKLDNVLRERAVIREMRASYLGEKKINPQALPPLLFAGVLLEGGIIGYDSNTKSGGSGARFLGIGGQTQYREDTVTVYLRAVSVKTGEVLSSVSMRKSIASIGVGASAFRYVAFRELLELESGISYNEPDQLALQQTIEASVFALIMEGAMQDLWCFNATPEEGRALLRKYITERDSVSEEKVVLPLNGLSQEISGVCQANQVASMRRSSLNQQIDPRMNVQTRAVTQRVLSQPVKSVSSKPAAVKTRPANAPPSAKPEAVKGKSVKAQPVASGNQQPLGQPGSMIRNINMISVAAASVPKPASKQSTVAKMSAPASQATDCPSIFVARTPLPVGYKPSVGSSDGCNVATEVDAPDAKIAVSKSPPTQDTPGVSKTTLSAGNTGGPIKGVVDMN